MPNKLAGQQSPYLIQHQNNPVDWWPWCSEAFELAKAQDKPVFLSIGYATCYWCHVMEKESFELLDVAEVLNEKFISIKVDREERPDLDEVYMQAVIGLTGHGGWPMSVFLTPERIPFFAGTYFPRQQFIELLHGIDNAWRTKRAEVERSASSISQYLESSLNLQAKSASAQLQDYNIEALEDFFEQHFDQNYGGFSQAPKFPPCSTLLWLTTRLQNTQQARLEHMVSLTLNAMAQGGLYDHLGGGFARYSTDAYWHVPHFEKMLYDNALLIQCYTRAYQLLQSAEWKVIVSETIKFLEREMRAAGGGWFSAQDAGDVGAEGEFYLWTFEQLSAILQEKNLADFVQVYDVKKEGNFEHQQNVLYMKKEVNLAARSLPAIVQARQSLFAERKSRNSPAKDDKIISAWNGLTLTAYANAAIVFSNDQWLSAAQDSASFILKELFDGEVLFRSYRKSAVIPGVLEDYAYLIEGLLALYQADFDLHWLNQARQLQAVQDHNFWDEAESGYFSSVAPDLIVRSKEWTDGATPNAQATSLANLFQLAYLFPEANYLAKALLLKNSFRASDEPKAACGRALRSLEEGEAFVRTIAVVVPSIDDIQQYAKKLRQICNSNFLVAMGIANQDAPGVLRDKICINGLTTYYVCSAQTCFAGTTEVNFVAELFAK